LSYIMCKAMNRSFFNVILGGFGGEVATASGGAKEQRPVKSGSADDAAYMLSNADTVIIVPGYGLAVARAQHAVNELAEKLAHKAKTVIVNKRSMAAGYAGLDNELFYMDKTMMVFGDAKKVVEDMAKAIE